MSFPELDLNLTNPNFLYPIPPLAKMDGWKEISIHECGEPLISLNGIPGILVEPVYFRQQISGAIETMCVREEVAARLNEVVKRLPGGLCILVWDAWRPVECQEGLFESFKTQLRRDHLDWNKERLLEETQKYVSLPSNNPARPSPHNTGGAIDLTLANEKGQPLPMGTKFDDFTPKSGTLYFEMNSEDQEAKNNRRLLYWLMKAAEFTNYPEEWWHFDFGNQFWGKQTEEDAFYGPVVNIP